MASTSRNPKPRSSLLSLRKKITENKLTLTNGKLDVTKNANSDVLEGMMNNTKPKKRQNDINETDIDGNSIINDKRIIEFVNNVNHDNTKEIQEILLKMSIGSGFAQYVPEIKLKKMAAKLESSIIDLDAEERTLKRRLDHIQVHKANKKQKLDLINKYKKNDNIIKIVNAFIALGVNVRNFLSNFQCDVCMNFFDENRSAHILTCGHTVCLDCLSKIQQKGAQKICFKCRKTIIPGQVINNYALHSATHIMSRVLNGIQEYFDEEDFRYDTRITQEDMNIIWSQTLEVDLEETRQEFIDDYITTHTD